MAVCALTMLDGMGDEVTVAGGAVLLALALILAWLSTHVAERGDHILGTILTAGAHVSLIGLGGGDAYIGGPSGPDTSEPPPPSRPQEDKPDDEDPDAGEATGEGGEGASGANVDQLLNIQGLQKRAAGAAGKPRPPPADKTEEEEEEKEEEEEEEGELDQSPKQVTAITVRLKFLNDTEELAVLRPQDTVGLLKSKCFSGQERQIKLIFQGRLLQDPERTLLSLNITHNSVVHCHVSQSLREGGAEAAAAAAHPVPGGTAQTEPGGVGVSGGAGGVGLALNTGSLVVPVFVVMLAVVWYFRINYRQFFTAPATISLVGVTIFFSFLVFGMYSR